MKLETTVSGTYTPRTLIELSQISYERRAQDPSAVLQAGYYAEQAVEALANQQKEGWFSYLRYYFQKVKAKRFLQKVKAELPACWAKPKPHEGLELKYQKADQKIAPDDPSRRVIELQLKWHLI